MILAVARRDIEHLDAALPPFGRNKSNIRAKDACSANGLISVPNAVLSEFLWKFSGELGFVLIIEAEARHRGAGPPATYGPTVSSR